MNNLDFTKIKWAGTDCILITARHTRQTIILTKYEIKEMIKELEKAEELK
jgi:hypothetical protein